MLKSCFWQKFCAWMLSVFTRLRLSSETHTLPPHCFLDFITISGEWSEFFFCFVFPLLIIRLRKPYLRHCDKSVITQFAGVVRHEGRFGFVWLGKVEPVNYSLPFKVRLGLIYAWFLMLRQPGDVNRGHPLASVLLWEPVICLASANAALNGFRVIRWWTRWTALVLQILEVWARRPHKSHANLISDYRALDLV